MFLSVVLGLLFILGVEEEHKERSGTLRGKLDHIIPFWLRKRN